MEKGKYVVALAILALTVSAQALPVGPLTIGDKIFDNFSVSGSGIDPNSVTVTTIGSGVPGDWYGIKIQGPFTSSIGGIKDFDFLYTVETDSGLPLITDIEQGFTLSSGGNGGIVVIGETVFGGGFGQDPFLAQSSVGFVLVGDITDPPGEPATGDVLDIIGGPVNKVWVTKDIYVEGFQGGTAGATIIFQRFSQTAVPDGGTTVMLLGAALSTLWLIKRRLA